MFNRSSELSTLTMSGGRGERNVALLCLDTVRKDFFDEYAPRLREMADLEFTQCRAASGWSVPSHASMFTGELPHQHGIHVYNRDFSGLSAADTFFADLEHHTTLGSSANVYASAAFGFDGIFDEFRSNSPDRRFLEGMDVEKWGQRCDADGLARYRAFVRAAAAHDHPLKSLANGALVELSHKLSETPIPTPVDDGAKLVSKGARQLTDDAEEPWFLFTNYMDAHGPLHHVLGYDRSLYDVPLTWHSGKFGTHALNTEGIDEDSRHHVEYNRELYGAAIDYLDRHVTQLVRQLQERSERETTVVVTADHGENMGYPADDELLAHKGVLTEGLLHVPLCVVNAPSSWQNADTDGYVSHLSLGRLLCGLARDEYVDVTEDRIPAERIGSNMAESATDDERAEWDRMIRVVYDGEEKYQWDSAGEKDRSELDWDRANWEQDVDDEVPVPELESAFFDVDVLTYKDAARDQRTNDDVDEATRQRLADLGYV